MKKTFYCLLALMFILSCSKDDSPKEPDRVDFAAQTLGKWKLADRIPNGVEFCELKTTIEFLEENNLHIVAYAGDEPGNCDSFEADGTWEYLDGTNKMKIQINGGQTTLSWVGWEGKNTIIFTNAETEVTEIYGKVN